MTGHAAPPSSLERDIDGLFAQPLGDFVAARNALAGRLKKEGRAGDAARVKGLPRPSISAWAVNQVYWHEREAYDRLLATGDALRAVQQQMLSGQGGDLRDAMRPRQEAARVVVDHAMRFLRDAANAATDSTRGRVAVAVDALAAYGSSPRDYTHGRLDRDLEPPGLEALSFLGTITPPAGSRAPGAAPPPAVTPPARNLRLVQGAGASRRSKPAGDDPAAARARAKAERAEREGIERQSRERERRRKAAEAAADRDIAAAERALLQAVNAEREAAATAHGLTRETDTLRRELDKTERRLAAASTDLDHARGVRERAEQALTRAREQRDALSGE